MAPSISIAVPTPASGWKSGRKAAEGEAEAALLRRRNAELEREVALLRAELEAARLRAEAAEEAEERLCVQLGEAECEALELARAYQGEVQELARELAAARSR
ncbi:Response to low sulfur 3 [Hordeum vulgare]|uniref:Predicted protein n=1 Tax=Hordeum vulgare subsp. vulgare TaxID=112509 RepID=F2EE87_HORVV|nr:protein RESPONSE TO LOW SULFUR 2-like [Hordeum vulgare subsp. vulgare]KAE8778215.1 Response to low sulfur 3 [Hordeum vulgare]KAI4979512.1 hypothetical protein ZWY2020_016265 [Hordeum vulgare]BAK05659.1 predicted protein [Hordeum vulgare subsp. vulgare]